MYAHGRMSAHRTLGILGIGLAGAFAFTAISQLNRDLVYADFLIENPGGIGPFEPWFLIGAAARLLKICTLAEAQPKAGFARKARSYRVRDQCCAVTAYWH